ncbi:YHS domain-containing protein [bacterium]|nr:MAG: YHS domain-containing protein [bacterium]
MAKDPICGMDVDEKGAEFMTHLEHETFYFCSKACQERFETEKGLIDPDQAKGWAKRVVSGILKEPKNKPPKCH